MHFCPHFAAERFLSTAINILCPDAAVLLPLAARAEKANVFFIHGANVNEQDARAWAAKHCEVFKRQQATWSCLVVARFSNPAEIGRFAGSEVRRRREFHACRVAPKPDEMGRADDGQVTLWQRLLARRGQSPFFAPPEPRQR